MCRHTCNSMMCTAQEPSLATNLRVEWISWTKYQPYCYKLVTRDVPDLQDLRACTACQMRYCWVGSSRRPCAACTYIMLCQAVGRQPACLNDTRKSRIVEPLCHSVLHKAVQAMQHYCTPPYICPSAPCPLESCSRLPRISLVRPRTLSALLQFALCKSQDSCDSPSLQC